MKKVLTAVSVLAMVVGISAQNTKHVFWYKVTTNNYNIAEFESPDYGPNIQGDVVKHEGIALSSGVRGSQGNLEAQPMLGNGLDNAQARSFVVWYVDLCKKALGSGATLTSAKFRGEYRDNWSGNAFCNAGPIAARVGVVDVATHLEMLGVDGAPEDHPEVATWQDAANPLSGTMGFNEPGDMQAQVTKNLTIPNCHNGTVPLQEGVFFELDVTEQVNYILSNAGQLGIAATVSAGDGSTGKVNLYGFENCVAVGATANRWSTDGNSCHLLLEVSNGTLVDKPIAAEKVVASSNDVSLSANPNPCNPVSTIAYNTGVAKSGMVKIFNAEGKLVHSRSVEGNGSFVWNGKGLTSGLYVCRIEAGKSVVSRNLVLMK